MAFRSQVGLSRARFFRERERMQEEKELAAQRIREPGELRAHELAKLRTAQEAGSAEAQREREFESRERGVAFGRAQELISPFLGGDTGGVPEGLTDARLALEESIEQRGGKAQSRLSSLLAKRGIFRSGAGVAAAAELAGETEASVAKARAGFAESAAERRRRERESKRATALQVATAYGGGFA